MFDFDDDLSYVDIPPYELNIFKDVELNKLALQSLESINYGYVSLDKLIYYFIRDNFMYSYNPSEWFIYKKNIWKPINEEYVASYSKKKIKWTYEEILKLNICGNNEHKTIVSITQSLLNEINTGKKDDIITENMKTLYCFDKRNDFGKNLESQKNLLVFDNCVFDFSNAVFRNGTKEDLVTMSTKYILRKEESQKKKVLNLLEQILPNKSDRSYFLSYLSLGLRDNVLEQFMVLTGISNGKNILIKLLKYTLGDYIGKMPSSFLIKSFPDWEDNKLYNLSKKRILLSFEPRGKYKLRKWNIRSLIGRKIDVTLNHSTMKLIEFNKDAMILFISDNIPKLDENDYTFNERLRVVNFPPHKEINVTEKDLKKMTSGFMLILTEYYKKSLPNYDIGQSLNSLIWQEEYQHLDKEKKNR